MIKDLKILELASVLAGPSVGSFFAELGAEVIKVENKKTGGDVTRNWKLSSEKESSISAYYASVNTGKKVLFLDYENEGDRSQLDELIKGTDIIITNFKMGDDLKFSLDYDSVKTINPNIIYGAIIGFPKGIDRTAFDVVLQAETGFISMNGAKGSSGEKMPVALIDVLAAHQLKEGILVALLKGKEGGAKVSVSLYDAAISSLANQASNWLMNKHIPKPIGTQHPNISPYGDMFQSNDEVNFVLAIGSDKHFQVFCQLFKLESIKHLDKNLIRVQNRDYICSEISNKLSSYRYEEIEMKLLDNKIPFGKVKNLQEVFEDVNAQKLVIEEDLEGVKTKKVKNSIFKIEFSSDT